jgi:hypothetical protein
VGFYDCRCLVTGVSLGSSGATAVVLRRVGDVYRPITLGITGTYDRFGSIDMVVDDANTERVLAFFDARSSEGRAAFHTVGPGRPVPEYPGDIEDLLHYIERNCLLFDDLCPYPTATLDGEPLSMALVAQPVWDALAAGHGTEPAQEMFDRAFADDPVAREIYQDELAPLTTHLRQMTAVSDFITARGLTWAPPYEPAQRYPTDYGCQLAPDEFLGDAKQDYADVPALEPAWHEIERTTRET